MKGTRFTFFQRDDQHIDFNRSVSKRGQIKMEEVSEVRKSTAPDAMENEIEVVCAQVYVHIHRRSCTPYMMVNPATQLMRGLR